MSFFTLARKLTGEVPGTPESLAKIKVNDALGAIYDSSDWSFTTGYSGWLCPGQIATAGTYTTTPYSPYVIADATATAILAALSGMPLITSMQYRDPARAIYNIIAYDDGTQFDSMNPGFATLTLDRPWMEPTDGPGQPYMIYQCYYVAPVQDFRRFLEVRDTTRVTSLDFESLSQADLARQDPQRRRYGYAKYVVPIGVDQRPGSSTLGWPMFELWPQQLGRVPYSYSFKRRGPLMSAPTDTVPYPLTEELVELRSKEMLLQYKAGQAEEKAKGAGAGWLILAGAAAKEYQERLSFVLPIDVNLRTDNLDRLDSYGIDQWAGRPFSNNLGGLNVGGYPER